MKGTRITLEPGTVVIGKLRVLRVIGRGATGTVYEVEHLLTKHHRALKVLHRDLLASGTAVSRFLREAGVAGTLGSERVVQTFDVGQLEDGAPYVLMELLRGETLAERLRRGTLLPAEAVRIAREIAAGMGVAHDRGIVHRDLKPANVFLARAEDGEEHVKILDFGTSKFTNPAGGPQVALTAEGMVLGTPHYVSPEQAGGGRDLDHRADVYSLGVILYEAFAGRRPYEADSFVSLIAQIHRGDVAPLDTLAEGIDPGLAALVHRAIHLDRERRPSSMAAFAAELEPFARDASTPEASPGTGAAAPPERRPRTLLWVAVGVALGGLAAGAVAWALVTFAGA